MPRPDVRLVSPSRALTGSWHPAQCREYWVPTSCCSTVEPYLTITSVAECECALCVHAWYSDGWHLPHQDVSYCASGLGVPGKSQLGPTGSVLAITCASCCAIVTAPAGGLSGSTCPVRSTPVRSGARPPWSSIAARTS